MAIQFPLYEASKKWLASESGCGVSELDAVQLVTASAFSKMIASTATYPHEVRSMPLPQPVVLLPVRSPPLKPQGVLGSRPLVLHQVIRSHMHVSGTGPFSGFASTCLKIARADGLRGFYRGCLTNLMRTTPAAALTFTSFELVSRSLHRIKNNYDKSHGCHKVAG